MGGETPDSLQIGTIGVGRGRLGLCRLPGLGGDLSGDLAVVADWRPSLVVSLTERAEMEAVGCGMLGGRLASLGIAWAHLPIRDFEVPAGATEAAWPDLAVRLHTLLDAGGRVLLHCRGGLGRSGMIALRLLIERGEEPAPALSRLRAVRPGAVETGEQMDWARAGRQSRRAV
ncbi:hypothetical protein [Jiella sp. M17.18]|uniref:phosphatase domain-containing putative toxin n=1 Tax=Jiella sp. M17.18 TaxID=3234247 RepID=UPI0034DF65B9